MASRDLDIVVKAQGATQAAAQIGNVDRAVGRVGTRVNSLASVLNKNVGGALSTFGGRLKQVGVASLGFLGVSGILSFGAALHESLGKAQTWGLQIEKLQGITHGTAEFLSGLLAVTE